MNKYIERKERHCGRNPTGTSKYGKMECTIQDPVWQANLGKIVRRAGAVSLKGQVQGEKPGIAHKRGRLN